MQLQLLTFFLIRVHRHRRSTLFPYTTLFRSKFVREGIIVSVATVLRIDLILEVGAAGESVTVEAGSPLLKTESGEVSHNLTTDRSEEHTSELQSRFDLVCRLLLEKKK